MVGKRDLIVDVGGDVQMLLPEHIRQADERARGTAALGAAEARRDQRIRAAWFAYPNWSDKALYAAYQAELAAAHEEYQAAADAAYDEIDRAAYAEIDAAGGGGA